MTFTQGELADYWADYKKGCEALEGVQTVDEVMRVCKLYWGSSSEEAFFPGGSGDVELLGVLLDAGWQPAWIEAGYYWAARQPNGEAGLTYIEGDLARGIQQRVG